MFSKRESSDGRRRGKPFRGETFRQKDWETDHILNLVLYDKAFKRYISGQKTGKGRLTHTVVRLDALF